QLCDAGGWLDPALRSPDLFNQLDCRHERTAGGANCLGATADVRHHLFCSLSDPVFGFSVRGPSPGATCAHGCRLASQRRAGPEIQIESGPGCLLLSAIPFHGAAQTFLKADFRLVAKAFFSS